MTPVENGEPLSPVRLITGVAALVLVAAVFLLPYL
jgi:hypothetical protein